MKAGCAPERRFLPPKVQKSVFYLIPAKPQGDDATYPKSLILGMVGGGLPSIMAGPGPWK